MSWDESLLLLIDGWVTYSRLNGPFPLLYAEKANPRLHAMDAAIWVSFSGHFKTAIAKRCKHITDAQQQLCFQFCLKSAELGIVPEYRTVGGPNPHHDAVKIIARYMDDICSKHGHSLSVA
jgi:hypothetical protein